MKIKTAFDIASEVEKDFLFDPQEAPWTFATEVAHKYANQFIDLAAEESYFDYEGIRYNDKQSILNLKKQIK